MKERTKEITHKIMSSIHSKNTRPEMLLRRMLWKEGFRYRVNYKKLAGKPDIVFTKAKLVVFCDGDFWHGHNWALRGYENLEDELKHYNDFWAKKITKNIERDRENTISLQNEGWTVLRFWASDIETNPTECIEKIKEAYCQGVK